MSASNCPETPRQKMIQMMYLVYTAMLALNVSAQVIDGFKTVSQSMDSANKNVELKIGDTFDNFANADKNNHDKVGANYEKALEIKKLSEDLAYYFDTTLYRFLWHVQTTKVAKVHIPNPDTTKKAIELQIPIRNDDGSPIYDSIAKAIEIGGFSWLEKLDDTHEATKYFLGNEAEGKTAKSGAAVEIKEKVAAYKKRVKELLGDDAEKVDLGMKIEDSETYLDLDGKPRSWEMLNFRDAVAGGALVSMVRIKAEVLNAEYEAVNMLYKQISANDYSFDKIAVITRPSSSYIMQGGTYELTINVGAYDSRAHFNATVGGATQQSNDTGAVVYKTVCNATGPKTVSGTVYVTKDGGTTPYEFKQSYYVAAPMAVFELTEMNVVYTGIDNPVKISVPGAAAHDVVVKVDDPSRGTITPKKDSAGYFTIRPTATTGRLKVNAYIKDGKTERFMGSNEFRIRRIPKPTIYLGKYEPGAMIPLAEFKAMNKIRAGYGDAFAFKMPVPTILNQTIAITRLPGAEEIKNKGANWNPETTSWRDKVKPGCKVQIEADVIKGDGQKDRITAVFTIKK